MLWVFIISLAIVLVCAYICRNSSDGIAALATSVLLISLFLSLLCAPWPIQCLLLILVLLSNRRYFVPTESIAESQDDKKIQLTYRGAKYEAMTPPMEVSQDTITGKYRGQVWRVRT
ncbi:MAG TPA: DUF4278 domain-containing protein [Stenomitos sp.]